MILSDSCWMKEYCSKYNSSLDCECKDKNIFCSKLFKLDKLYHDSLLSQKSQENKINELIKEIKLKKNQLKEHFKCPIIKSELIKKINTLKDDMTIKFEKNVEIKAKLGTLETKIKDKEKSKNKYKPLIISIDNNKNINSRNNSMNLKLNLKSDKINKKKLFNLILDDDMLNIPPSIRELFTEKELKAILLGLGKNKEKCKNMKYMNIYILFL